MVSDERMEKALRYLSTTDEEAAEAKTQVARAEFLAKRVRARVFLTAEGNVEARKATAETSQEVADADEALALAILAHEKLRAKRTTEELIIEVWRSVFSARKMGMDI